MPNYWYLHNTLIKHNSTIFKEQLTNISTVLNNTGNTTQLLTSFNALDVAQQKVLLSSKLLTEEQKSQCATMVALSSVNSKYTAEQLTRVAGVSAETLANWGLADSTDSLTIAELAELSVSDKQAKNVLDKIIAQNAQAVANGEVTASNIALASSEGGVTLATGAFTTAIKANIRAMWTWMTTTPIGWLTLLAGGVATVIGLYDLFTTSVKEQKEAMEDSLSAYEDAKSELSSITTELETQTQAMDELLAKDKLTYAEKGQLEELQAITRELRIQKDLAEKEEDRTEKQLAKDATDLFDKQFGDYDISEQAINKYQSDADITGNNAILISDENDISAMIAGYKQFNELLDEAYGSGSQDDIDHFKSLTEDLEDSIFTTAQELQTQQDNISAYYESIKDTPYEDLTTEQKEIVDTYNAISNAIALIYQQLDPNTWNSMQVDNIFSTDGIEKTKDELVAMAQSGELTPETIKGYTNLNNALGETTLSAQDLCDELYAIADAQGEVQNSTLADEKPVSFIGFSEEQTKSIDDFQSKLKTLSATLASLKDGSYQESDFVDLVQEFPDLQGKSENLEQAIKDLINDSLQQLYNTLGKPLPDDVKNSLQSMVDEAVNASVSLDDAFSAIQKSYEALNDFEEAQKGLGITSDVLNSVASLSTEMENLVAQYYAGLVGADELYAGLTEHYNNDMENYANALIAKNANSEQFYQSTGMMSAEVINSFMEDYNVDLRNCKTYNEAKLAIEQQALQKVSTMWAKYYDAQAKTINATGKHLLEQAETLKALDENAYHNFMSANDLYGFQNVVNTYKEASEALNDITFNGIESNFKLTSKNIAKTTNAAKGAGRSAKEAKDEFEELFDFFERRVKVLDNAFDLLKANLDNVTGSFAKNNLLGAQQEILETKIDEYTAAASMYQQKANEALSKLDSDIQEKIKAGAVNLTEFVGDANKEVVETIKDFETWADKVSDCNQKLAELGKTISQIELNKFENIMQDFNDQYNIRDSGKDIINKQIELFKESGQVIGEPFYQELIRQTEKQITGGEQEKTKLVEQLNDSLSSGKITVGSEEWVKEIGYLSDLEGQILDNKKAVEEYDNQILQLHWDSFDREKQQFSNLNDEISNLKDLLGDSDVADENGAWTKEGIAQLGLMAQQYELAEYNVKRYNDEIEWLNKEYLAGNYSTTEYADKLAELKKEQWDSVKASESAKDAIVELNKARIDIAIKGIEKEIDAFKKLTEAQLETLESSKNLHDYEKSISEKNKSIVQLQRQLAAMANDTSATAMAKKAKLEEQLAEAKEALEEEQYQHSIDAQKEALNKQAEDYEQSKNYEIESLQKTLEERETLIAESFETVKMNAGTVGVEIDRIAQEHGITVSQALTEPWKKGELAIASYGETLTPQTSYFIEILGGITRAIESIKIEADQTALKLSELFGSHTNRLVDDLNAAYTSADNLNKMASGLQSAFSELFGGNYNTGGISGALNSIKGAIDDVTSAANAASQAIANMGAAKVQSSTPTPVKTSTPSRIEMFGSGATATFVTKDDSGKTNGVYKTAEEATEALKKKKSKYASGTRNAKGGLRVTDEKGNELVLPKLSEGRYTIGNAGDQILTKVQTDNIFDWAKFNPADLVPYNMFGSLNMTPPEIRTRDVNNNTPVQIGNLISVQGNIDSSNIKQMESIANKAVDNLVYKMNKGIKYGRI